MNGTARMLRIASADLSNSSKGTDTDLDFRTNDADLHQIHRIILKTVIVPNTHYNINRYNNYISITAPDMLPVGPIEQGQYNLSQFTAALKAVLDVAASPYTFQVTQDPITRRLMFVKSGGAQFTLLGKSSGNKMWRECGCKTDVTSVGLVAFSSGIPDLSGLRHIYIESLIAGQQVMTGDVNKYSALADFPVDVPFGAYQKIEYDQHTLNQVTYRGAKQISKIDIRFTDDLNRELSFNGLDWVLIFEVHSVGA
jgi:hypothetical protein